jgi:hypothetical protein
VSTQPPSEPPPEGGWPPPSSDPGWAPPTPHEGGPDFAPPAAPGAGAPAPRTPGKATAALVLGIVGIFICPIVCSVLAIIFGQQAKREIDADPDLGGRGVAQAGFILGIVGLVLMVPAIILIAANS